LAIDSYNNNNNNGNAHNDTTIIMELWKLFPEAATVRDGPSRLFAFQLVAACRAGWQYGHGGKVVVTPSAPSRTTTSVTSAKSTTSKKSQQRTLPTNTNHSNNNHDNDDGDGQKADLDHLSTIFFLLRASPQVLREFV
jgi:hypothetical protein